MSFAVTLLEPRHNEAALALLSRTAEAPDRARDLFRVDRTPDFFALGRALGETRHYGAFDGGRCVGTLAVSAQRRFLGGQALSLPYVHDVRVDPACRGTRVFARLIEEALQDRPSPASGPPHFFATFLDDGKVAASLPGSLGRRFAMRALGRTRHRGLALFSKRRVDVSPVRALGAEEAWTHYLRLARSCDFAPADEETARAQEGVWWGVMREGEIGAVAKVVDEARVRRFVARGPVRGRALVNLLARWRGVPGLPAAGEPARVGYLSHLAVATSSAASRARATAEAAESLASFLVAEARATGRSPAFTYLFHGVDADVDLPAGRLDLGFFSRTYAFGPWPAAAGDLGFHELTLM